MELRELHYFLALVQEQNISRAAEALHVTQPTLSKQLSQLEEELGTSLFVRGKYLSLTEAGLLLKQHAEDMLAIEEKITKAFSDMKDVRGEISIACGGQAVIETFFAYFEGFRRLYPHVTFNLHTGSADISRELLDRGIVDLAILLEPIDVSRYDYIRFEKADEWGVLISREHELVKQGVHSVSGEDISRYPLVMSGRLSVQKELQQWFGKDWENLHIMGTYNLISHVFPALKDKQVVAVTIRAAVSMFDPKRYVFLPLDPPLRMTSVLAWKKYPVTRGLLNLFLEYVKSIDKTNIKI